MPANAPDNPRAHSRSTAVPAAAHDAKLYQVNYDRFRQLAATVHDRGGIVPVWKDMLLDTDTPVSAFAKVRRGPFAFLLESAPAGSETWSRYTYMGTSRGARAAAARRNGR